MIYGACACGKFQRAREERRVTPADYDWNQLIRDMERFYLLREFRSFEASIIQVCSTKKTWQCEPNCLRALTRK